MDIFEIYSLFLCCQLSPNHTKWALPQTKGQLYIPPPEGSLFCEYIL